jgi:hypothetical protein
VLRFATADLGISPDGPDELLKCEDGTVDHDNSSPQRLARAWAGVSTGACPLLRGIAEPAAAVMLPRKREQRRRSRSPRLRTMRRGHTGGHVFLATPVVPALSGPALGSILRGGQTKIAANVRHNRSSGG